MSKRDVRLFLRDMLEAIEKIERYTEGLTLEALWENDLVADAVVRNLEIIGEAARHVPMEVREQLPEINWRQIVAFRNVVIHEYFAVDLDIVWTVVEHHLPRLREALRKILPEKNLEP